MKIFFSPYFNGHTYVDYSKRSLLGEVVESEAGLLSRLELMCGMSYPDVDESAEKSRLAAYYTLLKSSAKRSHMLYASLQNDDPTCERYNVTAELLRWRDSLILAGWDKVSPLPGKLALISDTEKSVPADSDVSAGSADRWLRLASKVAALKGRVQVELRCPAILVPSLIIQVIGQLVQPASCTQCPDASSKLVDCKVIRFNELYQAYEWLAQQSADPHQVVVCNDGSRLDNVLNCHHKPITSGDAKVRCHHVVSDVRSLLDMPQSLLWIDCNGGYGFHYEYDFITAEEKAQLPSPVAIPDQEAMIEAVHNHYVEVLNAVSAQSADGKPNVTLVTAVCDTGKALAQHPMVASALIGKGGVPDEVNPDTLIAEQSFDDRIRFSAQSFYKIGVNANVGNSRMSYSALETLIQHPFNHVVERELGLYEPYKDRDVKTVKGTVAHKVIELMVREHGCLVLSEFDKYLAAAIADPECVDGSLGVCLLDLPENRFERDDIAYTLRKSLATLNRIIESSGLEIVGCEVSIPAPSSDAVDLPLKEPVVVHPDFGKSIARIDMILKKKGSDDYYIFDFKYSTSPNYAHKLEENLSIQFAFYKDMFNRFYKSGNMTLKGIGYYLFPKCRLYVPLDCGEGLEGEGVQFIQVDTQIVPDTMEAMLTAYGFRKRQLEQGIIEEGEQMPIDKEYQDEDGIFPLKSNSKGKEGPYRPNHIVLKNQIR